MTIPTGEGASRIVRVAATQVEPVWFDLHKTVDKACALITEAAENGAQLISFPEAFIPGYPAWIWTRPLDFAANAKYIKNSLKIDSPEFRKIQACAAKNKIVVSLGFSENDENSLYIAQATIDSDGALLMKRRKMKATHMERTVYGEASGNSLINVSKTNLGYRVGSLACWEHAQPLLKYNTYSQREEIHCAAWPPLDPHNGGPGLWSLSAEGCQTFSRTYAMESQAFVLHSTGIISQEGIEVMDTSKGAIMATPGGGYAAIFGPDGRQLSENIPCTEEGIVYADLVMDDALNARAFLDVCGHYSRADMLWLGRDTSERKCVTDKESVEENI